MATAKKSTTTKKSTSTSTAPKKPRAPKPVVEETKNVNSEPETPVVEAPKHEKEMVHVFIPIDPTIADRDGQYIEGSDNGGFFRLKRGQDHFLEKDFAKNIMLRIKAVEELEKKIEETRYKG